TAGDDARGIGRGYELPAGNGTARRALALAACKDAQQASRGTACGRGEMIVADVDHPSALPDWQPAQGDDEARIKLALATRAALRRIRPGRWDHHGAQENRAMGEAV